MGEVARAIVAAIGKWPDVEMKPHRFGGVEFTVGHREIGHLHGDRLADLPFPRQIRDELVASGRAAPHHILPATGWVSRWIHGPQDIPEVVALFRLNYDRLFAIGKSAVGHQDRDDEPVAGPDTER